MIGHALPLVILLLLGTVTPPTMADNHDISTKEKLDDEITWKELGAIVVAGLTRTKH